MTPAKLPRDLSDNDFRKAVARIGFQFKRQRGSHIVLYRESPPTTIIVPDHAVLKVGLLRKLIDHVGLTSKSSTTFSADTRDRVPVKGRPDRMGC